MNRTILKYLYKQDIVKNSDYMISLLQSRFLEVCQRFVGHDTWRTQSVPPIHHRLQFLTARRPRQPLPTSNNSKKSRCRRRFLPIREHLRSLFEITRLSNRRNFKTETVSSNERKRFPFELNYFAIVKDIHACWYAV